MVLSDIAGSCSTPFAALRAELERERAATRSITHRTGYCSESHPANRRQLANARYLTVMFCDLVYSV